MKHALLFAVLSIALFGSQGLAAPIYTQQFGLDPTDAFGANPASVTNAYIRHEAFAPQIQYWEPATPNAWSDVVYQFNVPFTIATASMYMSITAYTSGDISGANFDNNAQVFLDVSPDGTSWTNVLAAYPGHAAGYDTFTNFPNHDGDISSIVAGSNEVFVRARQFMTVDYSSFNASQFLRSAAGQTPFYVSAIGVPEPSSLALAAFGFAGLLALRWRRRNR
jgi:hypothetical protein